MAEEKKLPADLDEALGNPKIFQKICEMAESFAIFGNGEGAEKIDKVFEKVFSGILPPNEVSKEIKKEFGFSDKLSNDIATEMNSQIFSRYKNSLDELYQKETQKKDVESPVKKNIPEEKKAKPVSEKEEKLTPLEEELLKAAQTPKEIPKMPKEVIPEGKDEIDDVLGKLSEELEKEKQKREALNKIFRNESGK